MPVAKRRDQVVSILQAFLGEVKPLEESNQINILTDECTGARYCECHVKAATLISLGTTDAPLDPDEQEEYRANRQIVANSNAFLKMKDDARKGRTFSNIVAEYRKDGSGSPIKIIGGQHRIEAIKEALENDVDKYHGLKVYFMLTKQQRLDVQLISNTNIAVSTDLFDRMQETVRGPELRDWCQEVGLLKEGQDFTDRRHRGGPISVQMARTFITNFNHGKKVNTKDFATTPTVAILCPSGQHDSEWDHLIAAQGDGIWNDQEVRTAAKEFVALIRAQRAAFFKIRSKPDYPEKAMNIAILAAWAFVAGMLHDNEVRRKRHYALRQTTEKTH